MEAGKEFDGEDAEDSYSFSIDTLTLDDDQETQAPVLKNDLLSSFRQQWQRELESSPQRNINRISLQQPDEQHDQESEEEKAKQLFVRGTENERTGKLYEAVRCYRRAVQLVPDIEFKMYESSKGKDRMSKPEAIEVTESQKNATEVTAHRDANKRDLLTRIQQKVSRKGVFCTPEYDTVSTHISQIPAELMRIILCWVVGSELDTEPLERVGSVCRGLYIASRDTEIWRKLCIRTWGLNCGGPKGQWSSWRQMYMERPRVCLSGCYISRTQYLRHGENSFQDQFYRPWHQISYYRYLRFFSEGLVLMLTTPDEPKNCLDSLKQRANRNMSPGVLSGHYRIMGDKVILVVRKQPAEKKPAVASNTRFRPRRNNIQEQAAEQTFHLELQIQNKKSRRNSLLVWCGYKISVRNRNGTESSTSMDLQGTKFPPFVFYKVKSYCCESDAPLSC